MERAFCSSDREGMPKRRYLEEIVQESSQKWTQTNVKVIILIFDNYNPIGKLMSRNLVPAGS